MDCCDCFNWSLDISTSIYLKAKRVRIFYSTNAIFPCNIKFAIAGGSTTTFEYVTIHIDNKNSSNTAHIYVFLLDFEVLLFTFISEIGVTLYNLLILIFFIIITNRIVNSFIQLRLFFTDENILLTNKLKKSRKHQSSAIRSLLGTTNTLTNTTNSSSVNANRSNANAAASSTL